MLQAKLNNKQFKMDNFTEERQKFSREDRGKGEREKNFLAFPQNLSVISIKNQKSKLAEFLYTQENKIIRLYLKASE
ncbi:hypothetical protein [Floridanema aerugineum]|jgi:hypothetical protein|uniref:Uncharacterized protein n=1 Tax=Floridaenema aerugineum BLCC-F46 TaxID=3153654 RepID=A0ABV4XEK2_9CYAN